MNILFAASEAVPFAKSGGLGDVIGSLPKALRKKGVDVRMMLPLYEDVPVMFRQDIETVRTIPVSGAWKQQTCRIGRLKREGIVAYFIDNKAYYGGKGLYGYGDDTEKYVFFSQAVLEALPHLDFRPDVIHCHDWQTGLIPYFLKERYGSHPFYRGIKTVFTIHNLAYQGPIQGEKWREWLYGDEALSQLPSEDEAYSAYRGGWSCMKAGLSSADQITTVSAAYAEEIQTETFGENMDDLLRSRREVLNGILNGIDLAWYDPMKDPYIAEPFRNSLSRKRKNKIALQRELGLAVNERTPMIGIVSRFVEQKGLDLIREGFDRMMDLNLQLVVLGTGEERYERLFAEAAGRYPDRVSAIFPFLEGMARKIYAASDLFLMPSRFEPCGLAQMIAMRYRAVPIVRATGGLKDTVIPFDEASGKGNGFVFHRYEAQEMLSAIERAARLYNSGVQWKSIVSNISKIEFGWERSVRSYMRVYSHLLNK